MYVVAYDISDSKERSKIIGVIEQYCRRIQKSVWVSDLAARDMRDMKSKLKKLGIETGIIDIWESSGVPARIGDDEAFPMPVACHVV